MKYILKQSTGWANGDRQETINIEDYYNLEEWERLTDDEKENSLIELAQEFFEDYIEYSYKAVD